MRWHRLHGRFSPKNCMKGLCAKSFHHLRNSQTYKTTLYLGCKNNVIVRKTKNHHETIFNELETSLNICSSLEELLLLTETKNTLHAALHSLKSYTGLFLGNCSWLTDKSFSKPYPVIKTAAYDSKELISKDIRTTQTDSQIWSASTAGQVESTGNSFPLRSSSWASRKPWTFFKIGAFFGLQKNIWCWTFVNKLENVKVMCDLAHSQIEKNMGGRYLLCCRITWRRRSWMVRSSTKTCMSIYHCWIVHCL